MLTLRSTQRTHKLKSLCLDLSSLRSLTIYSTPLQESARLNVFRVFTCRFHLVHSLRWNALQMLAKTSSTLFRIQLALVLLNLLLVSSNFTELVNLSSGDLLKFSSLQVSVRVFSCDCFRFSRILACLDLWLLGLHRTVKATDEFSNFWIFGGKKIDGPVFPIRKHPPSSCFKVRCILSVMLSSFIFLFWKFRHKIVIVSYFLNTFFTNYPLSRSNLNSNQSDWGERQRCGAAEE